MHTSSIPPQGTWVLRSRGNISWPVAKIELCWTLMHMMDSIHRSKITKGDLALRRKSSRSSDLIFTKRNFSSDKASSKDALPTRVNISEPTFAVIKILHGTTSVCWSGKYRRKNTYLHNCNVYVSNNEDSRLSNPTTWKQWSFNQSVLQVCAPYACICAKGELGYVTCPNSITSNLL